MTQLRPADPGALAGLKVGDLLTHLGTKQLVDVVDVAKIDIPSPQAPCSFASCATVPRPSLQSRVKPS